MAYKRVVYPLTKPLVTCEFNQNFELQLCKSRGKCVFVECIATKQWDVLLLALRWEVN